MDTKLIRKYLLGQLAEPEPIERRIMTDRAFVDEVEAVEGEIEDEFLAGTLDQVDKAAFEKIALATPQGRENLRFARAFKKLVEEKRAEKFGVQPPVWSWLDQRGAGAGLLADLEMARECIGILEKAWWEAYVAQREGPVTRTATHALDLISKEAIAKFATPNPEAPDCGLCLKYSITGGPSHKASPSCGSGKRDHCACDTCF